MLFKVYETAFDGRALWWDKGLGSDWKQEHNAYIFNTESPSDMEAFKKGDCFDKETCIIKVVISEEEKFESEVKRCLQLMLKAFEEGKLSQPNRPKNGETVKIDYSNFPDDTIYTGDK